MFEHIRLYLISCHVQNLYVAFFECFNLTELVSFYNYGVCGRMNQVYCMVHYLEGIATNTDCFFLS